MIPRDLRRLWVMSREPKSGKTAVPKQQRFNDVKFVNWSLTAEQKAACKAWLGEENDVGNVISMLIEAGYKLTISWDKYRFCYTASIVPTPDVKENQGYILTGKGSTALKAAKQAMFIHYQIMDMDWAAYSTATSMEELDD
jgi:hypothetical protein